MPARFPRLASTLRARFFLALLLFGVVPLGLTGLGVAALDRYLYREQATRELVGLARGLAGELEAYVTETLKDASAIAALPDVASMEPSRQAPALREVFHHYPLFARVSVFALAGERLASSHPGGAPSIAERASFQTARSGRQAWEVGHALSTGRASFLVHTPIRDVERRVVGVLGVVVDMESLAAALGRSPLAGDERAYVLDAEGRIVLHPDQSRLQAREDFAWLGLTAGRPAAPGTLRYDLEGEARVAGFAPMPSTGWTVVVERPEASLLAPQDRSWRLAVLGVAASALLALLGAFALAGALTRPVRALAAAARALEAGDPSVPLPQAQPHDADLAALVRAFSTMREAVAARERELAERAQSFQALYQVAEAAEARFRALVEGLDAIVWEADAASYRVTFVSHRAEALLGYPVERWLREADFRRTLIHPQDVERVMAQCVRETAAGRDHVLEYRALAADGRVVWLRDIVRLVRDRQGQVRQLRGLMVDITEHKQVQAALEYQALHDALTGLPNRVLLQDRLQLAIREAQRDGMSLALLLMDLDGFKEVNDTLGHAFGDLLLQVVATHVRETVGADGTVARLGGDEFAVLLPGAEAEAAEAAASRLVAAFERPFRIGAHALQIGVSVGIALCPRHGQDTQTLLRCADVAMYVAKRAGLGYSLYAAEHDGHSLERLALVADLRRAIEGDELLLHFQPVADVRSGQWIGVEALVRWQHPQRGLVPPDQFIPQAEQMGLVGGLTRWVLNAALRQASAWRETGIAIPVAVNLSTRTLLDPDLPAQVAELLRRWRVPAAQLKLEITEGAIMVEPQRATQALAELRRIGVSISIDDFGTGYSSLERLKRLPVDELKIDRSFVRSMAEDPSDWAIVRSVVQLGHSLGLRVVAEGAEDHLTWEILSALGCDAVQGYYLSRPLPADEVLAWFVQRGPALRDSARAFRLHALEARLLPARSEALSSARSLARTGRPGAGAGSPSRPPGPDARRA